MPQTKLSEEQLKKVAAVDQFDKEQAFELGFSKVARDLGLNDEEYKNFYEAGCNKLATEQGK